MEFLKKLFGGLIRSIIVSAIVFIAVYSFMTGKFPPDFTKMKKSIAMIQGLQGMFMKTAEEAKPGETPEQMINRMAQAVRSNEEALAKLKTNSAPPLPAGAVPVTKEDKIDHMLREAANNMNDQPNGTLGTDGHGANATVNRDTTPTVVANEPQNIDEVSAHVEQAKNIAQKLEMKPGTLLSAVSQKDIDFMLTSMRSLQAEVLLLKAEIKTLKEKK